MSITITPLTPTDIREAREVVLEGLKNFGFSYNEEYDYDLLSPIKFYINTGGMFYVLRINEKIGGTVAIINKGNHIAELKRMYVNKEYQGKGFGTMLLDKAILFCRENAFQKLELETNKLFTVAHAFYQKHGFNIVKEDNRSYYMEKSL